METVPKHIKAPENIKLKCSKVDTSRIGAFSVSKIPKDTEFGPYRGRKVLDKNDESVDPKFSWEVFDLETFKYLHTVDATDPADGNWMRYVCCARFFEEQNIVSTQNGQEVFYKALKDIDPDEELLTWFQPKKKRRKRSSIALSTESRVPEPEVFQENESRSGASSPSLPEMGKRKRKPKIIPDSYHGPLEIYSKKSKQAYDDQFEPLQPGQKRRRRKKISTDSRSSSTSTLDMAAATPDTAGAGDGDSQGRDGDGEGADSEVSQAAQEHTTKESKKESGPSTGMSISEINSTVDWLYPERGQEYLFELKDHHVTTRNGKKVYQCDICLGLYKHMFSLKRHYLRNHVNYKYLSKADMTNCLINLIQVKQNMRERGLDVNDTTTEASEEPEEGTDEIKQEPTSDDSVIKENNVDAKDNQAHQDSFEESAENFKTEVETSDIDKSTVSEKTMNEESTGESQKDVDKTCTDGVNKDQTSNKNSESAINNSVLPKCIQKKESQYKGNSIFAQPKAMPGLFRCYTCYDVFDTVAEVREHVQNHPQQEEGTCFPCTQCNMRFNYKQNLVRHMKVHDAEGGSTTSSTPLLPSPSDDDVSLAGSEASSSSPLKPPGDPSSMYQVFRCNKCKTLFETLEAMAKHVQAEHLNGNKYQCQYCGKDFPSMPNMKKHVRFHLGYRVSCRVCPQVFPNVGALRKHTRLAHLEIYKARQLDRLEAQAALNNKGSPALHRLNNTENNRVTAKEGAGKESAENSKTEDSDTFHYDHDISFAADEIDDGGSRFKFSCTVCKKRFSNYINMCRHRRKSHSSDSKSRHEELSLSFCHKPKTTLSPVQEDPVEVAQFYANVAHNISTNLNCFIDGHQQSLEKFVDHIKIEDYSGNFGYNPEHTKAAEFSWEKYNFPPNYKPCKTISYQEIRKVVGIQNGFDSLNSEAVKSKVPSSETQNTVGVDKQIESKDTEMGKQSVGFKSFDSVKQNSKKDKIKVKVSGGLLESSSPESKSFSHVMKGEYASFDDLQSCDLSSIEEPRTVARHLKEARPGQRPRASSDVSKDRAGRGHNMEARQRLLQAAQAELEELYSNIDSHGHSALPPSRPAARTQTPQTLAALCEKLLGIRRRAKQRSGDTLTEVDESSDESLLMSELDRASQRIASGKLTNGLKSVVPDYSDVPDGSPFYNYESIAFGSSGEVVSVCAVCRRHFKDVEAVLRHHWKKHAGSVFQILEVEHGHEIDKLHFSEPSYVGALAVTDPGLDDLSEMELFTCTKCGGGFRTLSKLHVHIVNCSPIDPVYGATKIDRSPSKLSFTKKLQKRFNSLIGKDQLSKARAIAKKNGILLGEIKSQKRMFTGCRKRKSVLLPDSPIKASMLTGHVPDLKTGYNPHRHIRRRELTELVDTLTCEACGLKFKTIILLERHVKNCTKKEKFKDVQPLACPIMDESLARIKNICFYCEKNFTYSKSLINHFQDFCPVKRLKSEKGDLTDDERKKEEQIIERLKRIEDDKLIRDPDHVKKKITWQVGRKPKRKGHSWTYIKKRKQMLAEGMENGADEESVDGLREAIEEDGDEELDDTATSGQLGSEESDTIGNSHLENGFDEVDSAPQVQEQKQVKAENIDDTVEIKKEIESPDDYEEDQIKAERRDEDEESRGETAPQDNLQENLNFPLEVKQERKSPISDMSFDCTSRYQVNKIIDPKSKKIADPGLKSSVIFQCISKEAEKTESYKKVEKSNPVAQKESEETNSLIIRSKRKRERVSKVEEFLRNAFRRKRGTKGGKSDRESSVDSERSETEEKDLKELTSGNEQTVITAKSEDSELGEVSCKENEEAENSSDSTMEFSFQEDPVSNGLLTTAEDHSLDQVRKRGRPRKYPRVTDPVTLPKNERGRPRKYPRVEEPGNLTSQSKEEDSHHSDFKTEKRGRPPKLVHDNHTTCVLLHATVTDSEVAKDQSDCAKLTEDNTDQKDPLKKQQNLEQVNTLCHADNTSVTSSPEEEVVEAAEDDAGATQCMDYPCIAGGEKDKWDSNMSATDAPAIATVATENIGRKNMTNINMQKPLGDFKPSVSEINAATCMTQADVGSLCRPVGEIKAEPDALLCNKQGQSETIDKQVPVPPSQMEQPTHDTIMRDKGERPKENQSVSKPTNMMVNKEIQYSSKESSGKIPGTQEKCVTAGAGIQSASNKKVVSVSKTDSINQNRETSARAQIKENKSVIETASGQENQNVKEENDVLVKTEVKNRINEDSSPERTLGDPDVTRGLEIDPKDVHVKSKSKQKLIKSKLVQETSFSQKSSVSLFSKEGLHEIKTLNKASENVKISRLGLVSFDKKVDLSNCNGDTCDLDKDSPVDRRNLSVHVEKSDMTTVQDLTKSIDIGVKKEPVEIKEEESVKCETMETQSQGEEKANNKDTESLLPKSPEAVTEEKHEMVLSPSERVKMNKRSCMKDRSPLTPVWVRKPKPKPKPGEPHKSATGGDKTKDDQDQTVNKHSTPDEQIMSDTSPITKKMLFKTRKEAVNDSLKLLDKKVNSGYTPTRKPGKDLPVDNSVPGTVQREVAGRTSPVKGVKRKQADLDNVESIDTTAVKRRHEVNAKTGKNSESVKSLSAKSNILKVDTKLRDAASDKRVQKAK